MLHTEFSVGFFRRKPDKKTNRKPFIPHKNQVILHFFAKILAYLKKKAELLQPLLN